MRCPIDGETLVMADRSGVEIDYCPKCRGVWLDRGELDKIIERAGATASAAAVPPPARDPGPVYQSEPRSTRQEEPRRYRDDDDDDDYHRGHKRKRRDSFLSDLFDF
jgi:Zn-finger nucleic acid-binding protein